MKLIALFFIFLIISCKGLEKNEKFIQYEINFNSSQNNKTTLNSNNVKIFSIDTFIIELIFKTSIYEKKDKANNTISYYENKDTFGFNLINVNQNKSYFYRGNFNRYYLEDSSNIQQKKFGTKISDYGYNTDWKKYIFEKNKQIRDTVIKKQSYKYYIESNLISDEKYDTSLLMYMFFIDNIKFNSILNIKEIPFKDSLNFNFAGIIVKSNEASFENIFIINNIQNIEKQTYKKLQSIIYEIILHNKQ